MSRLRRIGPAQEVRVGRHLVQRQRFLQDRQSLGRIVWILRFVVDLVEFDHLDVVVDLDVDVGEFEFVDASSLPGGVHLEFVELVEFRLVNPRLISTHPRDDAAHPGWSAPGNPGLVCLPCDHAGDPGSGAEATPVRSGVEPPSPTQPR